MGSMVKGLARAHLTLSQLSCMQTSSACNQRAPQGSMEEVHGATDKGTAKARGCAHQRGWSHPSPRSLLWSSQLTRQKLYFLLSPLFSACPTSPNRDKKSPPQARTRSTHMKGSHHSALVSCSGQDGDCNQTHLRSSFLPLLKAAFWLGALL